MIDFYLAYAYARGYFDGRETGSEQNPYDHTDAARGAYAAGYERGVTDYCEGLENA